MEYGFFDESEIIENSKKSGERGCEVYCSDIRAVVHLMKGKDNNSNTAVSVFSKVRNDEFYPMCDIKKVIFIYEIEGVCFECEMDYEEVREFAKKINTDRSNIVIDNSKTPTWVGDVLADKSWKRIGEEKVSGYGIQR